jgi:exosortase A
MNIRAPTLRHTTVSALFDALRGTWLSLGVGLLVLGALFSSEVVAAVRTWIDSTAYNHCFLIAPIVIYLLWDRRAELQGLAAKPAPIAVLAAAPLAVGWLMAERLGIMEGRQLVAVSFAEVLFLAVLGWRLWWAVSGPLLYLYFLVPFGEFLVPRLQDLTSIFIQHGLPIIGIPAYIDGYVIEIAEGTFFVAEACAGLRFLIASIAFGGLYSLTMYRSPIRRATFLLVSIVTPIVANGFRALGIVVLGHILGSAQAAAADHVLYGWIFFSLVILMLIVLGLPFREDDVRSKSDSHSGDGTPEWPDLRMAGARPGLLAAALLTAGAAIGPVVAGGLNLSAVQPIAVIAPFEPGPDCSTVAFASDPTSSTATTMVQRIVCGPATFELKVAAFAPRSTAAPIMAERRRLNRLGDGEDVSEEWLPLSEQGGAPEWRISKSNHSHLAVGSAIWIDGQPARPGLRMRARMALSSLFGGALAPIIVSVAPVGLDSADRAPREQRNDSALLVDFLLSHADIGDKARLLAKGGS